MKKIKFLLILSFFVFSTSQSYSETLNGNSSFVRKLNLSSSSSSAQSVAERANKMGTGSAGFVSDPLMNSTLGGCYNMMQGMSGGSFDAQEMQKQQMDYVKQQMNNPVTEEE